jgi:hypothetical protein
MRLESRSLAASIPPPSPGRDWVRACSRSPRITTEIPIGLFIPCVFRETVYVLHAFQKKSPKGIKTAQSDVDLVERRLKVARQDYEARHGKTK